MRERKKTYKLLISLFVILTSCSADNGGSQVELCGDVKVRREAIVNGERNFDPEVVNLREPQLLAIGAIVYNVHGDFWTNICTGTLVSDNIVLTAAHCTINPYTGRRFSPDELGFWMGEDISTAPVSYFFISREIIPHPNYDFNEVVPLPDYDIALLILDESPIEKLGMEVVQPIPINSWGIPDELLNDLVEIAGYGLTNPNNYYNTRRYWGVGEVTGISYWSFSVDNIGRGSVCNGDSGGPALWRFPDGKVRLIGVASLGEQGCQGVGIYVNVSRHVDWLFNYIPCEGLDFVGECNPYNAAVWCELGELKAEVCTELGVECGYDERRGLYRCLVEEVEDPCQGETQVGRCEGDKAIWCEGGERREEDCSVQGKICAQNQDGNFRCIIQEGPCGDLNYLGRCIENGDKVEWCENGERKVRDCKRCDQVCGWVDEIMGYYCI